MATEGEPAPEVEEKGVERRKKEKAKEIAEEEVKEAPKEEVAEKKEEFVEERVYTIPLSKAWIAPRSKRSQKAIRIMKEFIRRHMKPESIVINSEVAEKIWSKGMEKPPRKLRVKTTKDKEGTVTVHLATEGD